MYRGMKSIKPYNSKVLFPAHLSEIHLLVSKSGLRIISYPLAV